MVDFPTSIPPSSGTAATTALGAASHNLGTFARDVDERLGELQAALGKYTASGFLSKPTLFDPAASTWHQSWHYTIEDGLPSTLTFEDQVGVGSSSPNYNEHLLERRINPGFARYEAYTQSDDTNSFITADLVVELVPATGVKTLGGVSVSGDDGEAVFGFNGPSMQAYLKAVTGQTDPVLDFQDSNAHSMFNVKSGGAGLNYGALSSYSTDGLHQSRVVMFASINPADGTAPQAQIASASTEAVGGFFFQADFDYTQIQAFATPDQTDGMLLIQDETGTDVLKVSQTAGGGGKVGFHNATPQAQGAAIADSTAVTVSARFNDLLAYLRLRGDIAT